MNEKKHRPNPWERAEVPDTIEPMDNPYPFSFDLAPVGLESEEIKKKAIDDAEAAGRFSLDQTVEAPTPVDEAQVPTIMEAGPGELPADVSPEDLPSAMIPPIPDSAPNPDH